VRLFKAILLLMLVASIVPTLMVGWLSVSDTREMLIRDAQELAQERVKQLSLRAEGLIGDPSRAVATLARVANFFQLPLEEQKAHLRNILVDRREVAVLTVFDREGRRIPGLQAFDIPPSEVAVHQSRAEALLPGLSDLRYSEVYFSPSRRHGVITLAFPVGDPVKGYVAAEVSLQGLYGVLATQPVGSTGFAYVADLSGRLVAGPGALETLAVGADLSARPAVAHLLRTLKDSARSNISHVGNFGEGDQRVVGAYLVSPSLGWAILSEQPIDLAYVQVRTMQTRIAAGAVGAMGVAAVLAWIFSRKLTRPLKGFIAGALELARGKFGVQVQVKEKNELGELAQTFNYMSSQLMAYDQENRGLYESLEKGYLETIVALANSIDSKDPYTRGHSQRVGDLAVEIGREMGLTPRELKHLHYGGILHDIGKIGIVEQILCKQSKLTDAEMEIMRGHPVIGAAIVEPVSFLAPVRAAVRSHHENWDGTGYPDRTQGEAIPLVARIVAAADTFDACTSTRPYSKAMPLGEAMEVMNRLRGGRLDPNVVDALRRVVEKRGVLIEGKREPVKLAS
jgi:putative nucleotidyltransferase with HDIG domain